MASNMAILPATGECELSHNLWADVIGLLPLALCRLADLIRLFSTICRHSIPCSSGIPQCLGDTRTAVQAEFLHRTAHPQRIVHRGCDISVLACPMFSFRSLCPVIILVDLAGLVAPSAVLSCISCTLCHDQQGRELTQTLLYFQVFLHISPREALRRSQAHARAGQVPKEESRDAHDHRRKALACASHECGARLGHGHGP